MAAPAGGPPGTEALGYLLGNLAAGQVRREQAGRSDSAGRAGAVRDHHGTAEAEQDSSSVALGVQPAGEFT